MVREKEKGLAFSTNVRAVDDDRVPCFTEVVTRPFLTPSSLVGKLQMLTAQHLSMLQVFYVLSPPPPWSSFQFCHSDKVFLIFPSHYVTNEGSLSSSYSYKQ